MNLRRLVALLLSYVFHPVWLLALSALWEARQAPAAQLWLLGSGLMLAPLLLLLLLRRLGKISSYHLPLRSERDGVYSLQLLWFGLLLAAFSYWKLVPDEALNRILLAVAGIGILSVANRYLNKASAHMAVVAALTGVYASRADLLLLMAGLAAMALVWFARSSLKAHSHAELLSGLVCGLLSWVIWLLLV